MDDDALCNRLLFGDPSLGTVEDRVILEATISFIKNLGRFDRYSSFVSFLFSQILQCKVLYYNNTKTNTTESKDLLQLRSLNIENKINKTTKNSKKIFTTQKYQTSSSSSLLSFVLCYFLFFLCFFSALLRWIIRKDHPLQYFVPV